MLNTSMTFYRKYSRYFISFSSRLEKNPTKAANFTQTALQAQLQMHHRSRLSDSHLHGSHGSIDGTKKTVYNVFVMSSFLASFRSTSPEPDLSTQTN